MSSSTAVITGPISVGSWVKCTPRPRSRSYSAATSSTAKDVNGMPSATSASLNGLAAGCSSGSRTSLGAVRVLRGHHGDPPMLAHRNVVLLLETEDLGVEPQRLLLVVDEHAGQIDSHGDPFPAPVTGRQSMMDAMESTRVDRWLWAVRLTKTRADAATACRGGHVRVNDRPAKPSATVSPGDEVRARVGDTTRIVEVVRVIQKRVGAADAVTCYLDRTPARPATPFVPVAARDRGAGRPTKRDRRILDRWRAGQV